MYGIVRDNIIYSRKHPQGLAHTNPGDKVQVIEKLGNKAYRCKDADGNIIVIPQAKINLMGD